MEKARILVRSPGIARLGLLIVALVSVTTIVWGALFAPEARAAAPYDLIYFDGHVHTVESDGNGTLADVKTAALRRGLSAAIVTNHANMLTLDEWKSLNKRADQLSGNGFLMINACEVTGSEGLFLRDHVLAWDVADPFVGRDSDQLTPEEVWTSPPNPSGFGPLFPDNIAKWARFIHKQEGIAVHAHPSGSTDPGYGVDFIEVFNLGHVKSVASYAAGMGFPAGQAWGLGVTLNNLALYGDRDLSMLVPVPGLGMIPLRAALQVTTGQTLGGLEAPLHSWDDLLMAYVRGELHHPTFGVANSDAHNTGNVTEGSSADYSDVGEAKNGVLVRGRLTQQSLFRAIRAGRLFATTGPSLDVTVNGKMMGDTATVKTAKIGAAKLELSVRSENPAAVVAQVTILKNGQIWKTLNPMSATYKTALSDTITEDGYYRVEVVSVDSGGQYQFAYSNPVFVDTRH